MWTMLGNKGIIDDPNPVLDLEDLCNNVKGPEGWVWVNRVRRVMRKSPVWLQRAVGGKEGRGCWVSGEPGHHNGYANRKPLKDFIPDTDMIRLSFWF